jgi:hypothetical protein
VSFAAFGRCEKELGEQRLTIAMPLDSQTSSQTQRPPRYSLASFCCVKAFASPSTCDTPTGRWRVPSWTYGATEISVYARLTLSRLGTRLAGLKLIMTILTRRERSTQRMPAHAKSSNLARS